MKSRPPLIALIFAVAISLLAPAAIAQPRAAHISLSPTSNHPQGLVTIRGTGFGPSEGIEVTFDDEHLTSATTDASGRFSARFRVPADATPAPHTVEAIGQTSGLRDDASFLVNTNWLGYRFDDRNNRVNPYENVLNTSNVSNLVNAWTFTGTTFFIGSAAVVDGVLYQSSQGEPDSALYAIDAATGRPLWQVPMNSWGSPSVENGTIFVMGGLFQPAGIYALDAANGSTRWFADIPQFDTASLAVAGGVVYAGSTDHHVYALEATTGTVRWATDLGAVVPTPPAVVGGVVYVGTGQGWVVALDASTGDVLWNTKLGGVIKYSAPTVANGRLYIGAQDDKVYALDAATGDKLWSFVTAGWDESTPTVSGGLVYVQSYYDHLYALDSVTGALRWETANGNAKGAPAVANGVVYASDYGGSIVALNALTGEELWSSALETFSDCSPVVANGMVFLGTNGYKIHAFTLP